MEKKNLTVFLVDDDPSFRFLSKRLCQRVEAIGQIEEFEDVYDALRMIMANKRKPEMLPDIIFLDLDFPTLNGWEFLEGFAELQISLSKKMPVFVVSSSLLKTDRAKADEFPIVKGFIAKPITEAQIRRIVEELG